MKIAKITTVLCSVFFMLTLMSCSTKLNFKNSAVVPAANGSVKVTNDNNNNYSIKLKVTNLAPPSRLEPKRDLYVVWLVTKDKLTKNIGQLNSSTSFFSSLLEGKLNTVSSFKPNYIFITAENDANIQEPKGVVVLTTK